ncbi:MAG: hypothetical protein DRP61_02200 [Candidatus Omnitrophota bacterium]|nr:MAG: hypothetical protein DRP61_02200 [Candidatus Omnitrophota bacterium]RKY34841.1 MAG: hypothetical protein DRP69_03500 [Candidatus Omnitrophota bacterium]RKY43549.1 MAG: hypothetical protein DRP80_04930 [Candidatus Omnitrophota bacterium]
MAVLPQVKKDMQFYQGLYSLLKVLKGIAVSQYQILEKKIKSFDKFSYVVESFLEGIDVKEVKHPFVKAVNENKAVVAITSDSGLLGGLNMQVASLAFDELESKDDILIIVGERGKLYAQEHGLSYKGFPGITEERRLDLALTLRDYLLERVINEEVGRIVVIYPKALSLMLQKIEKYTPLPYGELAEDKGHLINLEEFIQESSLDNIVEYLVYLWVGKTLYEILGFARLAELAARFIHLEESSQKLEDLQKGLKLKYHKLRHELTDKSMRELFAARVIYSK